MLFFDFQVAILFWLTFHRASSFLFFLSWLLGHFPSPPLERDLFSLFHVILFVPCFFLCNDLLAGSKPLSQTYSTSFDAKSTFFFFLDITQSSIYFQNLSLINHRCSNPLNHQMPHQIELVLTTLCQEKFRRMEVEKQLSFV